MSTTNKTADKIEHGDTFQIPDTQDWVFVSENTLIPDEVPMSRIVGVRPGAIPVQWFGPSTTKLKVKLPDDSHDPREPRD